ncbi:Golgi membrane protein 1 isoform X3 [Echinops telfairi]|uniref:Golgi membrane protein 1 isoform X3 n=1 Tax=Echinops telfairi TaxID=9371 RepID=A0AC55DS29_ECHTE|nr:Golgi membrane protein 1 isoform X3 [Echinops telfairi]
MMGLGNGRRSMKSPPLMLAALVACIIVLGFNYWIASSRSMDLKAVLVNNITTGERFIRTLQDQLKALQRNYGKLQQDVLQFQKNQTNLERKFSYDLSQCISQMKEVKEQCEEQIEEVTKKGNEAIAPRDSNDKNEQSLQLRAPNKPLARSQESGPPQAEEPQGKGNIRSNVEPQTPAPSSETALDLKKQEETNEIQMVNEEETQIPGLPQEPALEQATKDDKLSEGRGVGEAGELGQTSQVSAALLANQENAEDEDPERDQLIIREAQEEEEEQGAGERGRHPQKRDDYNMEDNQVESKIDEAVLLENNKSINGKYCGGVIFMFLFVLYALSLVLQFGTDHTTHESQQYCFKSSII